MLADLLDDLFDEPLALDTSLPHVPPAADANGFLSSESSSLDDEVNEETPPTSFSNQHMDRAPAVAQKRRAPSWTVRAKSSLLGSFAPSLTSSVHENIAAGRECWQASALEWDLCRPPSIRSLAHCVACTWRGLHRPAVLRLHRWLSLSPWRCPSRSPKRCLVPRSCPHQRHPSHLLLRAARRPHHPPEFKRPPRPFAHNWNFTRALQAALLQDRRLQGCAVAASYALAAHFEAHANDAVVSPWGAARGGERCPPRHLRSPHLRACVLLHGYCLPRGHAVLSRHPPLPS